MTYIVMDACIKCKFMDCVEVCPVDCFYEGENFLVIDPDECIDCGVCAPECPVDAIVSAEEVEESQRAFVELNASLAKPWPAIMSRQPPLPDAQDWQDVRAKLMHL